MSRDHLDELFREIEPEFGKFAITGNHEFYAGLTQAIAFTERCGFRMLRHELVGVGDFMDIAGVDDPAAHGFRSEETPEADILSKANKDHFILFLKHRPSIQKASVGQFDLQLSGHVHDGQIFPFRFLTRLSFPYYVGLHALQKGSSIYISRGSGTWGPPIRFLAPPEVTIIELIYESEVKNEKGLVRPLTESSR
jgi:uncharacterized protein